MTVEEAVLNVLIDNWPFARNDLVQFAHPVHKLSGCSRLRGLKNKGLVDYKFEKDFQNMYTIITSKERLIVLRDEIRAGKRFGERHVPQVVRHAAAPVVKRVPAAVVQGTDAEELLDIDEIRKFRESL